MEMINFKQFEDFLKSHIPPKEVVFKDDIGIKRTEYFMKLLGNPQDKIKVVHIAGTSGKGSTAYLVSNILRGQGFSVGLSVSPHMFDVRERMQVFRSPGKPGSLTHATNVGHADNLPSKKLVLEYFNQILPIIEKMKKTKYGSPTFFEINVALAYHMFAKEKLDYAVMETGLGGRLDATNCVSNKNKIAIITRIGYDHTEFLGKTLAKIAREKAGIIKNRNTVIGHKQSVIIDDIIKEKCSDENSNLFLIGRNNYKIASSTAQETTFDLNFSDLKLKNIRLGLIGKHQAENCSLALACLALLAKREKFKINEQKLRKALKKISIPGRFNILKHEDKKVIIDGAHNPQKMQIFIKNLSQIFPGQKFDFVLAFKKGKDFKKMLEKIIPLADKIYLSSFSVHKAATHLNSVDSNIVSSYLKKKKFKNIEVVTSNQKEILSVIKSSKKPVAITGSLYLIGSIYPYLKK